MLEINEQQILEDNVKALDFVNYQIAELIEIKKKLETKIKEDLKHEYKGSKTYTVGKHKVTVTTGSIYTINKAEYEIYKNSLSKEFNPVRESKKYEFINSVMKKAEEYASKEELLIMSNFITENEAKLNIKVSANA